MFFKAQFYSINNHSQTFTLHISALFLKSEAIPILVIYFCLFQSEFKTAELILTVTWVEPR